MVPGVGHLLTLRYSQLHVHGCHGDSTLSDPACEPGDQSDPPPRMKMEESTNYLLATGLLRSLDELMVSCACVIVEMQNVMDVQNKNASLLHFVPRV